MTRAVRTTAMLAVVALVGCQRAPTQPPEAGHGAPLAATGSESGDSDETWTEADEVSGQEMDAPVVVDADAPDAAPAAEKITFDDLDPVPGPTEVVLPQPARRPSGSLLGPALLRGPK